MNTFILMEKFKHQKNFKSKIILKSVIKFSIFKRLLCLQLN